MNSVHIVGRLTRDPEARNTSSGSTVSGFCVAVDKGGKDKGADFIDCQAWNKTAEFICQYFHKGDPIAISGKLTTRTYEKDGRNVKVTDVLVTEVSFVPRSNGVAQTAPTKPQIAPDMPEDPFEF